MVIRRQRVFVNWEETCQECGHVASGIVSLDERAVEELAEQLKLVQLSRCQELYGMLTKKHPPEVADWE